MSEIGLKAAMATLPIARAGRTRVGLLAALGGAAGRRAPPLGASLCATAACFAIGTAVPLEEGEQAVPKSAVPAAAIAAPRWHGEGWTAAAVVCGQPATCSVDSDDSAVGLPAAPSASVPRLLALRGAQGRSAPRRPRRPTGGGAAAHGRGARARVGAPPTEQHGRRGVGSPRDQGARGCAEHQVLAPGTENSLETGPQKGWAPPNGSPPARGPIRL